MSGEQERIAAEARAMADAADLRICSLADLDATPLDDPGWLARPIWPGDAYGVIGAAWKAGKTWLVCDLAVAVASGGSWCGAWPTPARPVLLFLSEGGRRKMLRRLRAVADTKGHRLADLPVRVSLRAPRINALVERSALEAELEAHPAGVVILDPWYLSAPGVSMGELVKVGEVLAHLQDITQAAGSALVISHHWNQTGQGSGAGRFSGAGMAEWGRVLMSVEVASATATEASSTTTLRVELTGDEIAPRTAVLRRHVEVVGDPDDLTAPLRYTCQPIDVPPELVGRSNAVKRVRAVLERQRGQWLDSRQIGDVLAGWGLPLKDRTIREAAEKLEEADATPAGGTERKRWCMS
jgi:hypothetical protein